MSSLFANKSLDFVDSLGLPRPVSLGHGVFACVATITPTIALDILTSRHIPNNRNQKAGGIAQYASDMASGRWTLTHQDIADMVLDAPTALAVARLEGYAARVKKGTP